MQQSIDVSCPPGPQQQTCSTGVRRPDGTDTALFHTIVCQHTQGVVGFLINFTVNLLENQPEYRLRFDRDIYGAATVLQHIVIDCDTCPNKLSRSITCPDDLLQSITSANTLAILGFRRYHHEYGVSLFMEHDVHRLIHSLCSIGSQHNQCTINFVGCL